MAEQYCMYLRKSRKDMEAEKKGEGATLERHERALFELAKRQKLNITHVFREIVSGETLQARPQMRELLSQIEKGLWKGVLVVEVERLTRGALSDQDLITKTFLHSKTLIVTPFKTYDLTNRNDAEYLTFGLFMSHQEYTTINRRQQDGRNLSVIEGKYPGNRAPFGYRRKELKNTTGWTLEEYSEEADTVRMIFDLYVNGELQDDGSYKHLGVSLIVRRLNQLGIKPQKSKEWVVPSVRDMLINPTYAGKVRWNWRATQKDMVNGTEEKSRPRAKNEDYLLVDGLHSGIIDEDTFNKAQAIIKTNPPRPVGERNTVKNPLAGLVVCGICKRRMIRRPYSKNGCPDTLMCAVTACPNVSSHLHIVEQKILDALEILLARYKLQWDLDGKPKKKTKNAMLDVKRKAQVKHNKELEQLQEDMKSAKRMAERGLYTDEEFIERRLQINEDIRREEEALEDLEEQIKTEETREVNRTLIIPTFEKVIDTYHALKTAQAKNDLLKEVLVKVEYIKEKSSRWSEEKDKFKIKLYPKLPPLLKP